MASRERLIRPLGRCLLLGGLFLWLLRPSAGPAAETYRNRLGMEFVRLPVGTFMMGSPPEEPHHHPNETLHRVTLTRPFYLQTTEVTLAQWRAVMGRRFFFRRKGRGDMPVIKVSWYDAVRFIGRLNRMNEGLYRLPTEAEWEYACRAGSTTAYSWGPEIDCSKALYHNNTLKSGRCVAAARRRGLHVNAPAPVKRFPPNAWGLYDMHGNVWEWCQDWYGPYPRAAVMDPQGPESGSDKVRRGGSWFGDGTLCRSANRNYGHPASRYRTTGFRLVLEALPDLPAIEDREADGP